MRRALVIAALLALAGAAVAAAQTPGPPAVQPSAPGEPNARSAAQSAGQSAGQSTAQSAAQSEQPADHQRSTRSQPSIRSAGPGASATRTAAQRRSLPPGTSGVDGPTEIPLPERVQRGPIVVRAERGMQSLATAVAERAPAALTAIRQDLPGLPGPATVEIRLVRQARDLGRAAPPGRAAPAWASGVAYPDTGVVVVATKREASPIDVHNVVIHELAHLALGAALGGRAPRWLDEGFAYLHSSDWSFARVRTLTGMVWTGDVIPLDEIERRFPAAESEVHRAYAQSYDFVAFLAKRGRYPDTADDGDRWPFQRFLILIGEGHDVYDASLEAFGAPLHDLFDEWRQDLRSRYMLLPIGMFALGVWVLAALLLIAAYIRKRRQNRTRLDEWERQEAEAHAGRTLVPLAPPPGGNHVADADDANAPSANVDPDRDRAVLDSDAPPQAKVLDFSTGAPIEPRADVRESDTDT